MLSLQQVLHGMVERVWGQTNSVSSPGLAFGWPWGHFSSCNMREGRDGAGVGRSVDVGKRMSRLSLLDSIFSPIKI